MRVCVCVALCAQPLPELVALTSQFLRLHGLVSDLNPLQPQRESAESREVSPPSCSNSSMSTQCSLFSECVLLLLPGRFLLCTLLCRRLAGCMSPRSQSKNPHAQSFQLLNNTKQTVTYFQSWEQAGEKTWTGVSLGGGGASGGGWVGGPGGWGL